MKVLIAFALLVAQILGCSTGKTSYAPAKKGLLVKFMDERFEGDDLIANGDTLRAEVSFRYPVFSGLPNGADAKLNALVLRLNQVTGFFVEDPVSGLPEEVYSLSVNAKKFLTEAGNDYDPDYPQQSAWGLHHHIDTLALNTKSNVVSLKKTLDYYTGGAHPNLVIFIVNVDLRTGEELSHETLFMNNGKLTEVIKRYFIANEMKVMTEAGLAFTLDDYFFPDGFVVPSGIGFTPQGLYCVYSPYEAAPYARGVIEFTVPYAELKGVLPERFVGK